MTIDHTGIRVSVDKFQPCVDFYLAALGPLGYEKLQEYGPHVVGLGANNKPDWWIIAGEGVAEYNMHVAFRAEEQKLVDEFHAAGLKIGAKDNGAPGPRPQYHPGYYGAFLIDPAGNNIEVVCHGPQEAEPSEAPRS